MGLRQGLTDGGLIADVLKEDAECLQELKAYVATRVLGEGLQEEGLHVLLQEEAAGEAENSCCQLAAVALWSSGTMEQWYYGLSSGTMDSAVNSGVCIADAAVLGLATQ